ncbi:RDD family protein [Streptomyces sp. NRRL F-5065]|uniref:RDD family protein n=1 Tax=Streptomyces sp. NRRL F-5065 TaxID=1463855 RepID=UPI0004C264A9|nr:RDD family protein [Streptomyces sp. NRRL F-5065]
MSAPTPAPGDDRPREGYYPDPSIPGYVRYWNGASWVAGTSRPAPRDGESLAPPPGALPSVEETGPHFFDEDPLQEPPPAAASQHGSRPEPAAAWGADAQPAGTGAPEVAWPIPPGPDQGAVQDTDPRVDPRVPHSPAPVPHPAAPSPAAASSASPASSAVGADGTDGARGGGTGTAGAPAPAEAPAASAPGDTFVFRRPGAGHGTAARPAPTAAEGPADEGTMTFRPVPPRTAGEPGPRPGPGPGAGKAAAARAGAARAGAPAPAAPAAPSPAPSPASGPSGPQGAGPALPRQPASPGPAEAPQQPAVPFPPVAPAAPLAAGPGGGQPSWAQQVHRLAATGGDEQPPVAPWKPPVDDVFQAAARRQAAARPAPLGKRLAARLVDTVVLAGVTAAAAVPLGTRAADHLQAKIEEARLSGETVTVWLIDGTTGPYLGIVLAVLLLFGVAYEVLPTAKWGRTLGKRLLGVEVRDIEAHEPPSFGAALRRWLVYSVPGLLVIGVVGVAWCLFDRPWHQCWHDKAAHTFVAG